MELLKIFVAVVLVVTLVAAEETKAKSVGKLKAFKKPYPIVRYEELSKASAKSSSEKSELKKNPVKDPLSVDTFATFSDALLADPEYIPSSASRENRGRSIDFEGSFHEDNSFEETQGHMDEDRAHFHKMRTARSSASGPQHLGWTLEQLQASHAAQGVTAGNHAGANEYLSLNATGTDINVQNTGNTQTSGSGTIATSGNVTMTTSN